MCGCSPANAGRSTSTKPTSSAPASRHNCRNHPASNASEIFGGSVCRARIAAMVGCSLTSEFMGFNQVEIVCENFCRTCPRERSGAFGSRSIGSPDLHNDFPFRPAFLEIGQRVLGLIERKYLVN